MEVPWEQALRKMGLQNEPDGSKGLVTLRLHTS